MEMGGPANGSSGPFENFWVGEREYLLLRCRIVILNYNGIDLLPLCLPSFTEALRQARLPVAMTCLDNQSRDQSPEWVRNHYPEIEVVRAPKNLLLVSFNDYLKKVDEDIVILMNNDIRVDPNFVSPLINVFRENPDAFMAAPQVLDFSGKKYEGGRTRAGIRWGLFWSSAKFPGCESLKERGGHTFASGFGAFHRLRFLALGGYDDLYLPGIMEDADLGFRAWRQGYRSYYVPESRVYHLGQASFKKTFGSKRILELAHRNAFLFIWKNICDPPLLIEHFLSLVPRLLFALLRGQLELLTGFFEALGRCAEAWRRRRCPLKAARSDRELFLLANGEFRLSPYVFKKKWRRLLAALFDGAGTILIQPWMKKPVPGLPKKILVVRADSLGDGVLTLPAVKALQERFPQARTDFLVSRSVYDLYHLFFPDSKIHLLEPGWFSQGNPPGAYFSQFIRLTGKLRGEHYDLGIDFRGDVRTILLMLSAGIPDRWGRGGTGGGFLLTRQIPLSGDEPEALRNLELVQGRREAFALNLQEMKALPLSPEVERVWGLLGSGKKIIIHVGAGYPSKRWSTHRFVELAKRIRGAGLGTPVFIGSDGEKGLLEPYRREWSETAGNLVGKTSPAELIQILKESDLFVGNDSGPAHLAALSGCKLVTVFSGTNAFRPWAPLSSKLRLIMHPVPCSPCEEKVCPLKRQDCLEDISLEEVYRAVEDALQS